MQLASQSKSSEGNSIEVKMIGSKETALVDSYQPIRVSRFLPAVSFASGKVLLKGYIDCIHALLEMIR